MELAVEKENEVAILKHQEELKERLQQLNAEIIALEQKQKIVSIVQSSPYTLRHPNFCLKPSQKASC